MQLKRDVLPAPLGPTRPKIWPGSTAKLTSCSTLMPPNCRLTSCKVSCAAILHLLPLPRCIRVRAAEVAGPARKISSELGVDPRAELNRYPADADAVSHRRSPASRAAFSSSAMTL